MSEPLTEQQRLSIDGWFTALGITYRVTGDAEAGRSAARRGQDWQRACAASARKLWPVADHVGRFPAPGAGDLTGVGDRIIECTVQPMENLAGKLRQAESDAIRSEFGEYYVWKKAVREPVERSYLITRASVLLPLLARLDRLERDLWEEANIR